MKTRFAPSPTGFLHVGNARVALFNWLLAKKVGGEFLLRIEDTDPGRSDPAYEAAILEDLKWFLGFEGEVHRQSEHLALYREMAQRLLGEGKAYECFCTREELERIREEALRKGLPPRYLGRCRNLSQGERERLRGEGRSPSIRFAVGQGELCFIDGVFGPQRYRAEELGDFIILRPDGWPTYNFACVVDDHHMGITHVIRGEDHLPNTPRQLLLYRAFGWQPPTFAHLPLLLGPDGKVLSKRHGPTSLREMREKGILPEALACYLLNLGGIVEEGVYDWEEMIEKFSLERLSRSQAVFDMARLLWFNRLYLRHRRAEEIAQRAGLELEAVDLFKEEVSTLSELRELIETLSGPPCYEGPFPPGSKDVISLALKELPKGKRGWLQRVLSLSGKRPREVLRPLRLALTGREQGPELEKIVTFLPEEEIEKRLKEVLSFLGGGDGP